MSSAVIHVAMAVILLTVASMVLFVGAKKAYSFGYDIFNDRPMHSAPGTDKLFVVEKDMGRMQCMDHLEKAGLIRNKTVALIQSYFFEYDIYPGTYTLNTAMTTKEILLKLSEEPTEAMVREVIEGDK